MMDGIFPSNDFKSDFEILYFSFYLCILCFTIFCNLAILYITSVPNVRCTIISKEKTNRDE